MASIYESQGPQVALTGPQAQGGFQPGQAYDASSIRLQQSEKDLNSFAQFSESLTGFLQNQAKQKNEEEYQLGLSEIIDGSVTPTQEQTNSFKAQTTLLQNAADVDTQVAKDLANNGQLATAEQFKAQSPAISGWRAYGRAVGSAKQVATNAQSFFLTWMESKDKVVPTEDGRMISPAEATTPKEIQAALAVGQQTLIKQSGIRSINPTIIAEHLAPTLQEVKGQMFANKLSSEVRKAKETAISDIGSNINSEFSNTNLTIEGMSESFQRNVKAYVDDGDLSRGLANDNTVQQALDSMSTLPEAEAYSLIEKFGQVRKIANDPNSITLASAYPSLFKKALDTVEGAVEADAAKQERIQNQQAEDAWVILKKAEQDATMDPGALKDLRKLTIDTLGKMPGATALKYRTELLTAPPNIDYTLYRQYREGIAQGKRPTAEQIDKDVAAARLSPEMGRELKAWSTTSQRTGFMKQWGTDIDSRVKQGLEEREVVSFNVFNKPSKLGGHVDQITNDLAEAAYTWYTNESAKGKPPTTADVNQFIDSQLPRVIGSYFHYNTKTKQFEPKPLSKNPELAPNKIKSTLSGGAREASGFNPRTIQLRSYNSGSTNFMSKAEVEENTQLFLSNQPLTQRAQQLANSTVGGPVAMLTQQAQHNEIDPSPILSSPQAQRLSQYSAVAPWATQRYLASGGNYRQQMLQLQRIVEAQKRASAKKDSSETFSTITINGIDTQKAFNALVGKESGGNHKALNTAGSGATGLGQVMPENIGPWTKEVLGKAMSQEEFRNNKAAQIRVVSTKFNQAIKSQLDAGHSPTEALRRAAAIWYSGSAKNVNSTKPQIWNGVEYPSVKQYADDILSRYARQT